MVHGIDAHDCALIVRGEILNRDKRCDKRKWPSKLIQLKIRRLLQTYARKFLLVAGANSQEFPKDFQFGVATAAYQIEGAIDVNGKTENIWDYQTHTFPDRIVDKSNGDIACDSYNKIDEDVKNLKEMKVDFYRISLSWTRILPTGFPNRINADGIRYYNELIDKLLANDIKPVVTIYHWDLPQSLQELGGWANEKMVEYFEDYAAVCFEMFGDRVKTWITINEPWQICQMGYADGDMAPYYKSDGIGSYLCGHNIILAHSKAYHLYKNKFANTQKGRIGITVETSWYEPASNSKQDIEAAHRMTLMHYGWFTYPIMSETGDYPKVMRESIDTKSEAQGFQRSRLPRFTSEQVKEIKGTYDFLGLNHYTTYMCKACNDTTTVANPPTYVNDVSVDCYIDENWEDTARDVFKVVPWGLRKQLIWIRDNYNNPEVIITENGYAGFINETTNDLRRVNYINTYLKEVLKAINEDGCNVTAYTAWSFMDNYEWTDGYTLRFGMYHVDFNDPNRPRTPKKSAFSYQNIVVTKKIQEDVVPDHFLH